MALPWRPNIDGPAMVAPWSINYVYLILWLLITFYPPRRPLAANRYQEKVTARRSSTRDCRKSKHTPPLPHPIRDETVIGFGWGGVRAEWEGGSGHGYVFWTRYNHSSGRD